MCAHRHTPLPLPTKRAWEGFCSIATNTPCAQHLVSKHTAPLSGEQALDPETVDSGAGAGKVQDTPGPSCCARKEGYAQRRMMEAYRGTNEGDEGAPSGQIQDNTGIKVSDSNELGLAE